MAHLPVMSKVALPAEPLDQERLVIVNVVWLDVERSALRTGFAFQLAPRDIDIRVATRVRPLTGLTG